MSIVDKSFTFAVRVVKLYKYLCDDKKEYVLSKQLLRSGTSIGANINESQEAQSKNILDFNTSIQYAQKKYIVDTAYLESHKGIKYIVIDDVFGNGSSMLTVMKKLYDTTHMLNYFFIVVKDVKR